MDGVNPNSLLATTAEKIIQECEDTKKRAIDRIVVIAAAHNNLTTAGVAGLPELDTWNLRNGFTVEVKDAEQWGKIHKAIGELECYDKSPVGKDARNKNIRVIMSPKNPDLNYWVKFAFVRKLEEGDKCVVKTKTKREIYVECKR
jgi:hypothetical protein